MSENKNSNNINDKITELFMFVIAILFLTIILGGALFMISEPQRRTTANIDYIKEYISKNMTLANKCFERGENNVLISVDKGQVELIVNKNDNCILKGVTDESLMDNQLVEYKILYNNGMISKINK